MKKPIISLIVACAENRVIGNQGKIPWYIKKDLVRFRDKTLGRVVIMGRTSFDWMMEYYKKSKNSLPKRIHVIITRNKDYKTNQPDCFVVHSIKQGLDLAKKLEKKEIFIAGGGEIYKQTINLAKKLYLTLVKGNFKGDAFFPDYKRFKKIISDSGWQKQGKYQFKFLDLKKAS